MQVKTFSMQEGKWQGRVKTPHAQLVLYFAAPEILRQRDLYSELQAFYPNAQIVGGSTSGEILKDEVFEGTVVGAAISFFSTRSFVKVVNTHLKDTPQEPAQALSRELLKESSQPLKAVFVLSDGLASQGKEIDGTAIVQALLETFPESVQITGGMVGDGTNFEETYIGVNARPQPNQIAAIGFYGEDIVVNSGSMGGWQPFGPKRRVTRSEGNILYELDGQSALELYKTYMSEKEVAELPTSGVLYPLTIYPKNGDARGRAVRTMLNINEETGGLFFAGDVPEGGDAQLMFAQFSHLVDGAGNAAHQAKIPEFSGDALAILVSCIGRKMVMGQMISDETAVIEDVLPEKTHKIGFYSYGEIAPSGFTGECQFHNQTMTITTIAEK